MSKGKGLHGPFPPYLCPAFPLTDLLISCSLIRTLYPTTNDPPSLSTTCISPDLPFYIQPFFIHPVHIFFRNIFHSVFVVVYRYPRHDLLLYFLSYLFYIHKLHPRRLDCDLFIWRFLASLFSRRLLCPSLTRRSFATLDGAYKRGGTNNVIISPVPCCFPSRTHAYSSASFFTFLFTLTLLASTCFCVVAFFCRVRLLSWLIPYFHAFSIFLSSPGDKFNSSRSTQLYIIKYASLGSFSLSFSWTPESYWRPWGLISRYKYSA